MARFRIVFFLCIIMSVPGMSMMEPERFSVRVESGVGFPALGDLNTGIGGREFALRTDYGSAAAELSLNRLQFNVPLTLRLGWRPFEGGLGRRLAFTLKSGLLQSSARSEIAFSDSNLVYEYQVRVIPLELGLDITAGNFLFLGAGSSGKHESGFQVQLGVAGGVYFGTFSESFSAEPNVLEQNLNVYPKEYSGTGFGVVFSASVLWKLSHSFGVSLTGYYRLASIDSLRGDIRQEDESVENKQLYISGASFSGSGDAARIDLSGPGLSLGFQYSLGKVPLGSTRTPVRRSRTGQGGLQRPATRSYQPPPVFNPIAWFATVESGLLFTSFADQNQAIDRREFQLKQQYIDAASQIDLQHLVFSVPLMLKLGAYPFGDSVGLVLRSGWMGARVGQEISFQDATVHLEQSISVIPVELGVDITLANLNYAGNEKRGSRLRITFATYLGLYAASLREDYNEDPNVNFTDLSRYPATYDGLGFGVNFALGALWRMSNTLGLTLTAYYRIASVDKLQGDIRQSDGNVQREQLYMQGGSYVSAPSAPDGAQPATINLSGPGLVLGLQLAFGN